MEGFQGHLQDQPSAGWASALCDPVVGTGASPHTVGGFGEHQHLCGAVRAGRRRCCGRRQDPGRLFWTDPVRAAFALTANTLCKGVGRHWCSPLSPIRSVPAQLGRVWLANLWSASPRWSLAANARSSWRGPAPLMGKCGPVAPSGFGTVAALEENPSHGLVFARSCRWNREKVLFWSPGFERCHHPSGTIQARSGCCWCFAG